MHGVTLFMYLGVCACMQVCMPTKTGVCYAEA